MSPDERVRSILECWSESEGQEGFRQRVIDAIKEAQAATRKEDMAEVCEWCKLGKPFDGEYHTGSNFSSGKAICQAQPIRELDQDALSDAKNRGDWR